MDLLALVAPWPQKAASAVNHATFPVERRYYFLPAVISTEFGFKRHEKDNIFTLFLKKNQTDNLSA